jgi:hypothetical protein
MDLIAMFKSLVEVLYHYLFTVLLSKRRASINAFRNEKGNLYGLPNQHRPATLVLHEQCRPIGSLIDTQARTSLEAQSCTTTPRCPERGRRRDRPGRGRDDVRESARSVMCDAMRVQHGLHDLREPPTSSAPALARLFPACNAHILLNSLLQIYSSGKRIPFLPSLRRTWRYGMHLSWDTLSLQCRDTDSCFFVQARSINGKAWSFWRNDSTHFVPLYTCLSFCYSSFCVRLLRMPSA